MVDPCRLTSLVTAMTEMLFYCQWNHVTGLVTMRVLGLDGNSQIAFYSVKNLGFWYW